MMNNNGRYIDRRIMYWLVLFIFLFSQEALAQTNDDFDIITIPVARSMHPSQSNLSAGTLSERGLSIMPVIDSLGKKLALGQVQTEHDTMTISLYAGEAVMLWSETISLNATSAYFQAEVQISGATPEQAAIAWIDADHAENIGASLSFQKEIPRNNEMISYEFNHDVIKAHLLIQFLGPNQGSTVIHLDQMRIVAGYQKINFTLGATQISNIEDFGGNDNPTVINVPPSTQGGMASIFSNQTHSVIPNKAYQALMLSTQTDNDVIQVRIPLERNKEILEPKKHRFYGQAYIKKWSGSQGILSVALFSQTSASGGIRDYKLSEIPMDKWVKIETSIDMLSENIQNPVLVLQLREGQSQILVDDVSLHKAGHSPNYWDADLARLFFDTENN